MAATETPPLIPNGDVTEQAIQDTLDAWAHAEWEHILAIKVDSATRIQQDVYLIEDANIPSMTVPAADQEMEREDSSEIKEFAVEMLSGETVKLKMSAPYTAAHVKQVLESRLGVPSYLQRLIAGPQELEDDAMITVDSMTLLRREPPLISTEDFLRTMVESPGWQPGDVFLRWHGFDTYRKWPASTEDRWKWALGHRNMRNVPLTTENVLECLDVWLGIEDKQGTHPDSFGAHVDKMVAFMQHCCYSPSLLVVYEELAQQVGSLVSEQSEAWHVHDLVLGLAVTCLSGGSQGALWPR